MNIIIPAGDEDDLGGGGDAGVVPADLEDAELVDEDGGLALGDVADEAAVQHHVVARPQQLRARVVERRHAFGGMSIS